MWSMRRAALAIVLCAAPLLAAPAQASPDLARLQAQREALRLQAGASAPGSVLALPLPERGGSPAGAASADAELRAIARGHGPQRVLVGLRAHSDLPAVARRLRALGARPEALRPIGVLAATVPSGAALVRALGADPRVAYLERDGELSIAADPFDTPDPQHGGLKFTWWYDDVRAGAALFAAGGGSRRSVAVLDTGLDVNHPEFAGSGRIAHTYETNVGGQDVTDAVGHGTFVTGLIAAVDGNGVGTKGVAGNTQILAIRASANGSFTERDLLRGIDFTLRRGGDVLNLSLAGDGLGRSVGRALATAFLNDVLPVAASGNKAQDGNPIQFPAALLGGRRGDAGIGLSVAATRPDGSVGAFSTHNEYVSLAAPGASAGDCRFGVFSTLPATVTDWDDLDSCPNVFSQGGARYAYAEGTSFAAPIASGIAALVWQIERRLASEQVAEVMIRSARQTRGTGWNEFTGTGIVDGGAATALARTYDVTAPRARGSLRRTGDRVRVRVRRARDRTERGRERAGGVRYGLLVSRNGGRTYALVRSGRRRPIDLSIRLRGSRAHVFLALACDANGNCGRRRLGRVRP